MSFSDQELNRLQKALKKAHFDKEQVDVGTVWKWDAMRTIRNLPASASSFSWLSEWNALVWKFAMTTAALLLVLSTWSLQMGVDPEMEMAWMLFEDPVEETVNDTFGF